MAMILCITIFTAVPCYAAAYYSKTARLVDITKVPGVSTAQGFAAGTTYLYSVKTNSADTKAVILKTNISSKKTVQLIDEDTGLAYNNYLGHGNDIALFGINGSTNLYIVDRRSGSAKVTRVKMTGSTTYKRIGTYTTKFNGSNLSMSGVAGVSKSDSGVELLFMRDETFYRGFIGVNATSGNVNLTKAFTMDRKNTLVNGKKVANLDRYITQGIAYYNGKLYVTAHGATIQPNVSAILVFDSPLAANNQGKILQGSGTSFRITSSSYSVYEIEGCGISNGTMYFNCNRKDPAGVRNQAICYFTDFSG